MEKQVSTGLKTTFLAYVILGLIFGIPALLVPKWWGDVSGWPVMDVTIERVVGASILAFVASSWWAYREAIVEKVKIIVKAMIVWTVLLALVFLLGLLFEGAPATAWMKFIIMAAFAVAFIIFYPRD